jgi:two-component system chemotaxis response regulator CheY
MHKVLVVDDSLSAARYLSMVIDSTDRFEIMGHAKSGEQAMEMFRENKPDVVFMDIILPGINGIETTRKMLEQDSSTNIIVLSSMAKHPTVRDDALKVGACDVISKPVRPNTILNALQKIFPEKQ